MNSDIFFTIIVLIVAYSIVLFLVQSLVNADSVIATIPIQKWPLDLGFNTVNDNVYVSQAGAGMSVIDALTNTVTKTISIPATSYFYGSAYNPANQHLYVANDTSSVGSAVVIDTSSGTIVNSIPLGDSPVQVLYNPFNGYIYVTVTNSQRVDVIDPSSKTVIASIPVGIHPAGIAYNPNNHLIYVTNSNQASSSVSVINSTTNTVKTTIPIPGNPWRITFDSNKGDLYVTLNTANKVAVIDGDTNSLKPSISMPVFPPFPGSQYSGTSVGSIAYNSFNKHVYVTHSNSEYVTAIDDSTNTVTKTIKVGHYPWTIGYHPKNHNMYVANVMSDSVSVIGTENALDTNPSAACPEENVKHWDKIVFMVTSTTLAKKANVPANTELDIKVLDNPKEVADLKQKVLNFLGVPNENKTSLRIIDVEYAIICTTNGPVDSKLIVPTKAEQLPSQTSNTTMNIPFNDTMLDSSILNKLNLSSLNSTIPEQLPPQSFNGSTVPKI